jgi:hypothetical protein
MGYLHIPNLYRPEGQDILMFKEAWAMEKIHGTSCNISYDPQTQELRFFSGGESHEKFLKLFNQDELKQKFVSLQLPLDRKIVVYGEGAGGKQQGMSHTYGPNLFFIVFDVKIGDLWLDVPKAEKVATDLGLEFVHYVRVPTDLKVLDAERDAPSVQAIRNGVSMIIPAGADFDCPLGIKVEPYGQYTDMYGQSDRIANPRKREGVVLRPLVELRKNNGERLICKHKGDDFKETATPRPVVDPAKQKLLEDAQSVADDFVTPMRLQHVLDKLSGHCMERMKEIIGAMIEDVNREGVGEFTPSPQVNKAIGSKTVVLYKDYLNSQIGK